METKFTPGPWCLTGFDDHGFCIESNERAVIVSGFGHHRKLDAENENKPNAHLIAAAPDMYEMLDKIHNSMAGNGEYGEFYCDVKDLLAKARGE